MRRNIFSTTLGVAWAVVVTKAVVALEKSLVDKEHMMRNKKTAYIGIIELVVMVVESIDCQTSIMIGIINLEKRQESSEMREDTKKKQSHGPH